MDGNPQFWEALRLRTNEATNFEELFLLSSLRKKALAKRLTNPTAATRTIRLGLVAGYSLHPLSDLLVHLLSMEGIQLELWSGSYDNYIGEIMEPKGELYRFAPEVVFIIPSAQRCRYTGKMTDSDEEQQAVADGVVSSLLQLAERVYQNSKAEVIMANFLLPPFHDMGSFRSRTFGSDWVFRKWVNLRLGLSAPPYLHICDLEFLAYRLGGIEARDDRGWYQSKQLCSPALLVKTAREVTHTVCSLRRASKKVLALDLDNTLWGGVVADDGLEGIELGDTSPRGEAFKAFQLYITSLKQRGVLLAICSKNDPAKASEVFTKHPEMVLKMEDVVAFKVNWEPKSNNLHQLALDLNVGLDSIVFVDDNPAEIEIVRQFAPEVTTILLSADPSEYVAKLQDSRFFEIRNFTSEDANRTRQYQAEAERREIQAISADMPSYLRSLEMKAVFREFTAVDIPRIAQLINKSNQFNLTTRRRTEAELLSLLDDREFITFSLRLQDRFGDHGLISVIIANQTSTEAIEIDTWLMSCRVLKRRVEDEVLNELARLARARKVSHLKGVYLPTPKNSMVESFYPDMGFSLIPPNDGSCQYQLELDSFRPALTQIVVTRRTYESN